GALVPAGEWADVDAEAFAPNECGEVVTQPVRGRSLQGPDRCLGERVAVGLVDVEDVDHHASGDGGDRGFVAGGGADDGGHAPAGGRDPDGVLSTPDVAAEALPAPVAGDVGRLGALSEDGDGVPEAVAVEARGDGQVVEPPVAGHEGFDTGGQG